MTRSLEILGNQVTQALAVVPRMTLKDLARVLNIPWGQAAELRLALDPLLARGDVAFDGNTDRYYLNGKGTTNNGGDDMAKTETASAALRATILEVLKDGTKTRAELVQRTEMIGNEGLVTWVLKGLINGGQVVRVGQGVYQLGNGTAPELPAKPEREKRQKAAVPPPDPISEQPRPLARMKVAPVPAPPPAACMNDIRDVLVAAARAYVDGRFSDEQLDKCIKVADVVIAIDLRVPA